MELSFRSESVSTSGVQKTWQAGAGEHHLELAVPPEFQGVGGAFSPEDLYSMALANCLAATFKVIAQNSRFEYEKLEVKLDCRIEKVGALFQVKELVFDVDLVGAPDVDKGRRLLDRCSKTGILINSVQAPKTFHFRVNGEMA